MSDEERSAGEPSEEEKARLYYLKMSRQQQAYEQSTMAKFAAGWITQEEAVRQLGHIRDTNPSVSRKDAG